MLLASDLSEEDLIAGDLGLVERESLAANQESQCVSVRDQNKYRVC